MNSSISLFEIGENTLKELENLENEIVDSNENEKNSNSIIEDSPNRSNNSLKNSIQHKTLNFRLKLATQKQCEVRKSAKTRNDLMVQSNKQFEISSVSKYINTDSLDDMDFSAWERSIEKIYSPAVAKTIKQTEVINNKLTFLQNEVVSKHQCPEDSKHDIDNVTFIMPQDQNLEDFKIATRYIDNQLSLSKITDTFNNESVITKSKFLSSSQKLDCNNSLIMSSSKDMHLLSNWNLPSSVVNEYQKKGVEKMFDWQCECLQNPKVLFDGNNLVYSAPTSAGKTLVSEILMIKNILERRKKVLFILPFVSLVREKIFFLQDLLSSSGIRVDGYYSGYQPAGGFDSLNLIICTIEKANSIVNRLLEQNKLEELGMIVIDEIHLISDPSRGYILELLLTKVLFMCQKFNYRIQLVTMSATLPNADLLCKWLKAEFFKTDYRPIELKEMIKIDKNIYDCDMNLLRSLENRWSEYFLNDSDDVCSLAMETILENYQLIIFCSSKDGCEQLATNFARGVHKMLKETSNPLENLLDKEKLEILLEQGKSLCTGLDQILERCLKYGSAFHHAGLTTDERDLVEMGFKEGIIKVLVATSTLSSGVNLPARRVIIRSPMFGNKIMSNLTYKQMIGRAGRKGKDTLGESILVCNNTNSKIGKELISVPLKPIASCLNADDYSHFKRALLEIIAANVANTKDELKLFINQTLYCQEHNLDFNFFQNALNDDLMAFVDGKSQKKNINDLNKKEDKENDPIKNSMNFLLEYDFIRLHSDDEIEEIKFVPTRLGVACLSSSMPPKDGFMLLAELQKARQNFVLECDLHAIYLVTPFSVAYQLQQIDWTYFLDLYDKLPDMMKRVGKLVGISDTFLTKAITGRQNNWHAQQIHKRFYIALALQEIVNEEPIANVSAKYKIPRGLLQNLQQSASTFASILTTFCQSLKWNLLALILQQFRERLFFGIHPDLIDLMKLPSISSTRIARALFNNGIESLTCLANSTKLQIEDILLNSKEIHSGKFFISGKALELSIKEFTKLLIEDAQIFLKNELGLKEVKWKDEKSSENLVDQENIEEENKENYQKSILTKRKRKMDSFIQPNNSSDNNDSIKFLETPKTKRVNMNASIDYKRKLRSSVNKQQENDSVKDESNGNSSLFKNSGISVSLTSISEKADLISNHMNIIEVLSDKEIYDKFANEIFRNQRGEISMSIGIERVHMKSLTIGGNLLKSNENEEKFNFKFNDNLYIACICLSIYDSNNEVVYYLDLQKGINTLVQNSKSLIKKLLLDMNITINMYDAREHIKILENADIHNLNDVNAKVFDPRLCSWIMDPDNILSWQEIVRKFAPDCDKILEFGTKFKSSSSLGLNLGNSIEPKIRSIVECFLINKLKKGQLLHIKQTPKLLRVLENLEMPIQKILARMEHNGYPINKNKLYESIEHVSHLQRQLENTIYKLNGRKFDITSTKEVAKVVGIHRNKEKKKISTGKTVLAKLDLPIADYIVMYRTISTTISNIQPMTKLVKNDRIYGSSFSLTQTGRISMQEPNLQNVTKDFEIEFKDDSNKLIKELISFRSVFQCQKGKILISADFCQLELRILTHLCKDPKLLEIMRHSTKDIFRKIASKWNHISEEMVTDEQRNQTKQLCYGLIYGMGNKALAEKMNVDEEKAAKLIEEFHRTYPYIRKYTEQIVRKTKELGYIETVTCRRRYLPLINSDDSSEISKAERQALNSTIQGSASDLVKNAILKMEKNIKKMKYDDHCNLVLHLHDELIYEVSENCWKDVAKILSKSMENCVTLNVPLLVKIKIGSNWGELKEVGT